MGSHLYDVIAVADHPGAIRLQVDIQVKRTADPVPSDAEWKSVIGQCLAALAEDPDGVRNGHHLLALAARAPAGHLEELAGPTQWAWQHDNPASFTALITADSGAPNTGVRSRWGHLRTTITDALTEQGKAPSEEEVTEAAFWIAHALHVWVAEAEIGERRAVSFDRPHSTRVESTIHTSSAHRLVSRASMRISQPIVAASLRSRLLYPDWPGR